MVPKPDRLGRVDSRAEERVAELLSQVCTTDKECAFYSVLLPEHEYKRMAEIDFLIVWDDLILVVEVKGGLLSREQGLWSFVDRYGNRHHKREGPFAQARSAMFALEKRLRDSHPLVDVAFGFMVVTPNDTLKPDVEWEAEQYLGSQSMSITGFEKALRRAHSYWRSKGRPVRGGAYRAVVEAIRPDFDRIPPLHAIASGLESQYVRLAEEQYSLVRATERNPRILCSGGAGSGKTILAAEVARRAAADGQHVLLTCRSEPLAAVLKASMRGTDVVCLPLEELKENDQFDLVVVDEAQDVLDVDTYLRIGALIDGNWALGRWRLFYDGNNQAGVGGVIDKDVRDELELMAFSLQLPRNCRNTASVVRQTRLLTGAQVEDPIAGDGPKVEYSYPKDEEDAASLLDRRLEDLARQEVDLKDVAVITMRSEVSASSAVNSRAYRSGRLSTHSRIRGAHLVTAREIKGLEVAHACVVDVDEVDEALARARLYVGMTRPRISLSVSISQSAKTQLGETARLGDVR